MTIQQVLQTYLAQLQQQQAAYQADINNLINMLGANAQLITEINTWLAANPA